MLLYILLPIINVFLFLCFSKYKNGKKIYLVIALTVYMLISTFRKSNMGADYHIYVNVFKNIRNIFFNYYPMERGFLLLNYIVSFITSNYIVLSFIINAFIFYVLYKYINNYVEEKYYLWILFIFLANPYLYIQSTFNVVRQTIAICIVLIGIRFLINKKYLAYLLFVLIAGQFHSIGYIFILLVFIKMINWNEKKFFIIATCSVIVNIAFRNNGFINWITNIFGYEQYINYQSTLFDFLIYVLFVYAVTLVLISFYKRIETKEQYRFFIDIYIISLAVLPIFITNDIMYRVYIGLVFISLPAISIILENLKNKLKRSNFVIIESIYIIYYSMLLVLFLYSVIKSNNTNYIPFKFFWQ